MKRKDISDILKDWTFDPDILNVRRIEGEDGTDKIQLRLDLGLLQMEVDGRPDGETPYNFENFFEYLLSEQRRMEESEDEDEFILEPDDLRDLQQESIQYYHRYLCFAELGDHEGVVRDTEHNLMVLQFVEEFAEDEESAWSFIRYFPYIKMMNVQARVQILLEEENYEDALDWIDRNIDIIKEFNKKWGIQENRDSTREIRILLEWRDTVLNKKPLSKLEKLREQLDEAVRLERYEEAAQIRDKLEKLHEEN